ncbi:MAG: AAA family ATPase [Deltaproteobacteria bacterium]|jgi:predicted ATPase|nr:AAA family ATPase [Deltaproteobacteria bacterium]
MKLRRLDIKGFKSIDGVIGQSLALGDLTVLLGANGSGKSNLLAFFEMLRCMAKQELAGFVGKHGASRLLFYGPKFTNSIVFKAFFDDGAESIYEVELKPRLPEGLFINYEKIDFGQYDPQTRENFQKTIHRGEDGELLLSDFYYLPKNQRGESGLAYDGNETGQLIHAFLSDVHIYQFNDTSETAKIKDRGYVDDARFLRRDAGNLAAFLKMLKGYMTTTQ